MTVPASTIPTEQIPLVIQDKSFVPTDTQLIAQDPTWDKAAWGGLGSLWLPARLHAEPEPRRPSGLSAMGRWDYGPWMGGMGTVPFQHGPVANPLAGQPGQNALNPGDSEPVDRPRDVHGHADRQRHAYPFLKVRPKAYRFRILNAANDRFWNLQLYYAKSNTIDSVDGKRHAAAADGVR